ncbi:MAG: HDOD domain-containing protein [Nitrospiraceae bacterium]|nr:HDOD domain-containing protein [Nitrospiraceae bacterium]
MARILIIDDDPEIAEILDLYADFLGYEADTASSGEEAIQKLAGNGFYNAIFCDLTLQGLNGFKIFDRISESDKELSGRFVLLTGATLDGEIERQVTARKIKVIQKPFNFDDIKASLESLEGMGGDSKDILLRSASLPAVPVVAARILEMVGNENTSLEDLKKTIMSDNSLTSRMLQMANSVFFRLRQKVDTVSDAINVLGFNTIRTIALAVSTRNIYKNFGLIEQKLWEHSLGVSLAAGMLMDELRLPKSEREEAVIAGLMHDVGKIIMDNGHPDKFLNLVQTVHEEKIPYHVIEKDIFGFSHAQLGSMLAEKWGFSESLSSIIFHHHGWKHLDKTAEGGTGRLCLVIALADALCARVGIGYKEPMPDLDLGEEELKALLKIGSEQYDGLITSFKEAYLREKVSFYLA